MKKFFALFALLFQTIRAMRCFEGNAGIQKDEDVSVSIEMYNNLQYDQCPGEVCMCCSYYYNVSDTEHCVSWTSESHESCMKETPQLTEASYEVTTRTCSSDGCNNCFDGISSASKVFGTRNSYVINLAAVFLSSFAILIN